MSSRFLELRLACAFALLACCSQVESRDVVVCADPDDMPFSHQDGSGFENRIAELVAQDLRARLVYRWQPLRRGVVRKTLGARLCDVLMGVPVGMKAVATSIPYYRSSYVFVTPAKEHLAIASFSDPRLNGRRIGLQILEEDMSPPSLPLIRSGHAAQLVGFPSFGSEAGEIVQAVANGRVGVAVVWGPLAGYYAQRLHLPVKLTAVEPAVDPSGIPFTFDLAVGVHRGDSDLLRSVNASVTRLRPQIQRILAEYAVPLSDATAAPSVRPTTGREGGL